MSIRIIAGSLKGRIIPFSNKKYNDADITPQKVKGALFSSLGEELRGKSFLDLYGGSGQVGIEALSRGAHPVVINEKDKKRSRFIASFFEKISPENRPLLLNLPAPRALKLCHEEKRIFNYIFLDPPYDKTGESKTLYEELLNAIEKYNLISSDGKIIIQHFSATELVNNSGGFSRFDEKKYGTTTLSYYGKKESTS